VNRPPSTSCRPLKPAPASRRDFQKTKTRFPALNHERHSTNPRYLPPTSPTLLARAFARAPSWAATSTLTSPSKAWLPTCFHAPSQEALDPPAVRYSLRPSEPHTARQYLQQSAPRALQRPPRLPMGRRRTVTPSSGIPFSGSTDQVYSGQGSQALRARRPPSQRPLASTDLPQPDQPEHPMSHLRVASRLEELEKQRPCGIGPLTDEDTWFAETSSTFRLGPLCKAPRERVLPRAASEVPSTSRADQSFDRPVELLIL
jgi:hypothetical protein